MGMECFWQVKAVSQSGWSMQRFMAVAVKSAAFAVLLRVLLTAFGDERFASAGVGWPPVLSLLAILSMTVANLIAGRQQSVKRMLAYSSIAHAGYMLMGVAVASPAGRQAILFYLAVYLFMNLAAFTVVLAMAVAMVLSRRVTGQLYGLRATVEAIAPRLRPKFLMNATAGGAS